MMNGKRKRDSSYDSDSSDSDSSLFMEGEYSDATLVVGNNHFPIHRCILANVSDVFKKMLLGTKWAESDAAKPIVLNEVEICAYVFRDFLRYIYTGEITWHIDSVVGHLILADKYNVTKLTTVCNEFIANHLRHGGALKMEWYHAASHNNTQLQVTLREYMKLNIDHLISTDDWLQIRKEDLISVLKSSFVVVKSEYALVTALIRWLSCRPPGEKMSEMLKETIPLIRFPMINGKKLTEFEETDFVNKHRDELLPYLFLAYRFQSTLQESKNPPPGTNCLQYRVRNYLSSPYSTALGMEVKKCSCSTFDHLKSYNSISHSEYLKNIMIPIRSGNQMVDRLFSLTLCSYGHKGSERPTLTIRCETSGGYGAEAPAFFLEGFVASIVTYRKGITNPLATSLCIVKTHGSPEKHNYHFYYTMEISTGHLAEFSAKSYDVKVFLRQMNKRPAVI